MDSQEVLERLRRNRTGPGRPKREAVYPGAVIIEKERRRLIKNKRRGKYTGDCQNCQLHLADFDGGRCPRCGYPFNNDPNRGE